MYKFVLILSQCCTCESRSVHSIERRNCCGKTFVLGNCEIRHCTQSLPSDNYKTSLSVQVMARYNGNSWHLMTIIHTGRTCTGKRMFFVLMDPMHDYTNSAWAVYILPPPISHHSCTNHLKLTPVKSIIDWFVHLFMQNQFGNIINTWIAALCY